MKIYLLLVFTVLCFFQVTFAQDFHLTKPDLIPCNLVRTSAPLNQIVQANAPVGPKFRGINDEDEEGQIRLHKAINPNALPKGLDPALQKQYYTVKNNQVNATLNLQFPGLGFTGVNPSDNNMASGPNHIIQMINNSSSSFIRIWDKAGNILVSQIILSSITGLSGGGDPVVLYDNIADRYIISEFANTTNNIFICVSQTADPTGAYFVYNFATPEFPDYFKIAAWGNSYVVTSNENEPAIYAMDRAKMLTGTPSTTVQRFTIPSYPTIGFQAATPVDISGATNAPANSPALVMRMADDAWTTGITDRLEIFSFNVDWVTPANTTLTGPDLLPTLPFSTNFCGFTTFSCIPQQGSSVKLDPLREVLMNKVSYRNFGTHESIVCCHVNELDGTSHAGIRWYELRKTPPSANWVIYQQGTYGLPADPLNRWMSCIAINAEGSIGLGYNVAGTTSFPSIRFTGRRACDPLGEMTEPEQTVIAGTAPNASIRYGDYNAMTVDPVNGSFWFTANYNPASQWATRIGNFSLSPGCGGCSPTIITQPVSASFCNGANANFSVVASGSPLTYQWQLSTNGGTSFTDITNATASSYSFATSISQNNYQYRCIITGTCTPTTVTTTAAILTVNTLPAINTQPVGVAICAGSNTNFTVAATGTSLTYQWQLSTNGGTSFTNIANSGVYTGATASLLNVTGASTALNNNLYRCIISGACTPALNSTAAALIVNSLPAVTQQPVALTVCAGNTASFSVTATGSGLSYQWQQSSNGGTTFSNITGAGSATYSFTSALPQSGYQYRCVVSGTCVPAVTSAAAVLTVGTALIINTQPAAAVLCAGGNTSFATAITGTVISYQWQESTNGGTTFSNITNGGIYSGATLPTLTLTGATAGLNNNQYRCVVTGSCPAINTTAALLTVNTAPVITAQPVTGNTICATQNTSFSVTATGTALTYQWQVSNDGGSTYSNLANGGFYSTVTTATLNISNATDVMNTSRYRCVIGGTCTPSAASAAALLTVFTPVTFTAQPANKTICATGNTSLSVTAAGTLPTYQWQISTDGGATFTSLNNTTLYSGVTTATLSFTGVVPGLNNNQYRCMVTGAAPCGAVNSAKSVLTVSPQPTIALDAAPYKNLLPGLTSTITATTNAATPPINFAWFKNNTLLPNVTANDYLINVDRLGEYRVTVTDANGCTNTSSLLAIADSASNKLFIYPSPNNGQFTVAYHNPGGGNTKQSIVIYNSIGKRVYTAVITVTQAYQLINIDLRRNGAGIYYVVLRDASDKKIKTGEVLVR
jgi:hypothetical protein